LSEDSIGDLSDDPLDSEGGSEDLPEDWDDYQEAIEHESENQGEW
jgi:hypothetical protein